MCGQSAWFAEGFAAIFATDLSSNAVGSQMISERISVGVLFGADVALGILTTMGRLVDSGG